LRTAFPLSGDGDENVRMDEGDSGQGLSTGGHAEDKKEIPRDEASLKLLYLALRNITQRWTMPVQDWRAALNRFAITF
jgi:hypothetical protein